MDVELIKFKAEHIKHIHKVETLDGVGFVQNYHYEAIERTQPESYTIKIDGDIVACAGVIEYWPGRGEAWAVIDLNGSKNFMALHKTVQRYLDQAPFDRIEAAIIKSFSKGHRWAKSLGFACEAPTLRKYGVSGIDYSLYAKVRE